MNFGHNQTSELLPLPPAEERMVKPAPNASRQNHTTREDERKNSAIDYRLHFSENCFFFFVVGCLPIWSPWYRALGTCGQSTERLVDRGSRTFSQEGCSHASLSEMLDGHGHHNGWGCYHMTVVRDS